MPNDYFQFQQFRIDQADCAQKVSTDACILGAATDLTGATRVLDLGTGTGLLALMAAQRAPTAMLEAIEIDAAAATQAAANVAASAWVSRIQVRPLSLADYVATQPAPFSHVICNPPFFRRSLVSSDAARNAARHEGENSLTFGDIIGFAGNYLLPAGTLTVLLPPTEMRQFEQEAQAAQLSVRARLLVQHRPGGRTTRCISTFGRGMPGTVPESNLVIQETDGTYSAAFRALLSGFYLAL